MGGKCLFFLFATAGLAGCGQGSAFDQAFRNSFRESAVNSCITTSRNTPNAPAGFDWQRLCSCSIDRLMRGKTSAELRRIAGDSRAQMDAVRQCANEMGIMPGAGAPTSGKAAPGKPTS